MATTLNHDLARVYARAYFIGRDRGAWEDVDEYTANDAERQAQRAGYDAGVADYCTDDLGEGETSCDCPEGSDENRPCPNCGG